MHSSIFYFFSFTLLFSSLTSQVGYNTTSRGSYTRNIRDEKRYLEAQILHLKKEKEIYEGRYHWYQNQADQLQFERGYLLEARRYWKLADMARLSMENIDTALAILASQKKVIQAHKMRDKNNG